MNADAGGWLRALRLAAFVTVPAAAVGSWALIVGLAPGAPGFVMLILSFWLLAPFAALGWVNAKSHQWVPAARVTVHVAAILLPLGSFACYANAVGTPVGSSRALILLFSVPIASWLLMMVTIAPAAMMSRRLAPDRRTRRLDADRPRVSLLHGPLASFSAAVVIGFALWLMSPYITGGREAFDAPSYYCAGMAAAGLAGGLLWRSPAAVLMAFLGVWAGQVFATLALPALVKYWSPLAVIVTGAGSVLSVFGSAAGIGLRSLYERSRRVG
jgi:hypothetical protein